MGFLVQIGVDWRKTNHRGLSSLNHRHPDDTTPQDNVGSGGVDVRRDLGLTVGNKSHNNRDGKDQQTKRDAATDPVKGGGNTLCLGVSGNHDEVLFRFVTKEEQLSYRRDCKSDDDAIKDRGKQTEERK